VKTIIIGIVKEEIEIPETKIVPAGVTKNQANTIKYSER